MRTLIMDFLFHNGANPAHVSKQGFTIVHLATLLFRTDLIELILEYADHVEEKDLRGMPRPSTLLLRARPTDSEVRRRWTCSRLSKERIRRRRRRSASNSTRRSVRLSCPALLLLYAALHQFLEKYNLADHKQVFKSNKLYLVRLRLFTVRLSSRIVHFLGRAA